MDTIIVAQKMNEELLDKLSKYGSVVQITEGDLDTLRASLPNASCIILGTWLMFTSELMDISPKLKVISRTGVGVDNVDVESASKKGIMVLNTPKANALSVAEHALTLICSLAKYTVFLNKQVKDNNFKARRLYLPVDLDGKTLGLIGLGNIGKMVAEKCNLAFNMKVIAYDPFVSNTENYIQLCKSPEEVYKNADFLSIHLPLVPETKNLINQDVFSMMKKSSFIVNTSRGGIINETDLFNALKDGTIAGAALDVFESEPPVEDCPLFQLENIILSPHSAALTKECTLRVAKCAVQGVIDYLSDRQPEFIFNKNNLI